MIESESSRCVGSRKELPTWTSVNFRIPSHPSPTRTEVSPRSCCSHVIVIINIRTPFL